MSEPLPAWSWQFEADKIRQLPWFPELEGFTSEWAWGSSTGTGVKVAVIDSGIDNEHPAIAGHVQGYISFFEDAAGQIQRSEKPHKDVYGHGTACADIIRRFAPDCELYSIQVLGSQLTGKGTALAAALRWAIEHGMQVTHVPLGSDKQEYSRLFYELADAAYFKNIMLVTAANNIATPTFPSLYATVTSVASHKGQDPYEFYYNPAPPVEFGAPGINVTVAWLNCQQRTVTGNSFAASHITGLITKILGKHPGLTPFQMKMILRATARNVRR